MWDEVTERDLKYMREALREAEAAGAAGDVPVGAIVQSRLRSLTYGTPDARGGAARSLFRICDDPRTHHRVHVRNGILAEESASLLTEFFRAKRKPRP